MNSAGSNKSRQEKILTVEAETFHRNNVKVLS